MFLLRWIRKVTLCELRRMFNASLCENACVSSPLISKTTSPSCKYYKKFIKNSVTTLATYLLSYTSPKHLQLQITLLDISKNLHYICQKYLVNVSKISSTSVSKISPQSSKNILSYPLRNTYNKSHFLQ